MTRPVADKSLDPVDRGKQRNHTTEAGQQSHDKHRNYDAVQIRGFQENIVQGRIDKVDADCDQACQHKHCQDLIHGEA